MQNYIIDPKDLLLESYNFLLPEELIAQRPSEKGRDTSKLLVYEAKSGKVTHDYFYNLDSYLPSETLLVFNQSKVFPSRLKGQKKLGGKVEVFFLGHMPIYESNDFHVLIKSTSKKKINDEFFFQEDCRGKITKVLEDGTFHIAIFLPNKFISLLSYLEIHALVPIPPYIRKGESDDKDKLDYQTTYSKHIGSVAAPTAGLHFTSELRTRLKKKNIEEAFVSLHVSLGTFRPVSDDYILNHKMHREEFFLEQSEWEKINHAKKTIAVGTTSLRVLESLKRQPPSMLDFQGPMSTDIFLYPGTSIQSIQGLITNFHLPKSSLLILVSSLIGRKKALELYQLAIENKYRFFSYGDAMLILI